MLIADCEKDNDRVINLGRAACVPVFSNPNVRFQVNQIEDLSSFHAVAYCNIHGLWANSLEQRVYLGPSWYIASGRERRFKAGDEVTVSGSQVTLNNEPYIIATTVKWRNEILQ